MSVKRSNVGGQSSEICSPFSWPPKAGMRSDFPFRIVAAIWASVSFDLNLRLREVGSTGRADALASLSMAARAVGGEQFGARGNLHV